MATCMTCGRSLSRYSAGPECAACVWDARNRIGEPPPIDPAFWEDPRIRQAAQNRDLQTIIRAYLDATGLTQEALALLVNRDQGTISKIIRGQRKRYTIDDLEAIRDNLRAPGRIFGLLPGIHESRKDKTQPRPSTAATPATDGSGGAFTGRLRSPGTDHPEDAGAPPQHEAACAQRWRDRATENAWPLARVVEEIRNCCGVSLLHAQRLARGWTLKRAAQECQKVDEREKLSVRVDAEQLGAWEARRRHPGAVTIDLLCRVYRTDAKGLGLTGDRRDHIAANDEPVRTRATGAHITTSQFWEPRDPFDEKMDSLRRTVDRTLAAGTATPAQMDLFEERASLQARQYIYTPPRAMLTMLLPDLEELQALSRDRQPGVVQGRLSELTALMSILVADALMKLGNLPHARAWFATACAAADDSSNVELRARVRAQAAMLPYYYGPPGEAVRLARDAHAMLDRPSPTAALAAAAEARALARNGDAPRAQEAIRHATEIFERSPSSPDEEHAFAFPERRLLFYLSGAYTYLGQCSQAQEVQRQALPLYPDQTMIDPTLMKLEAAMCLAREHSVSEACELAGATVLRIPEEHRTPIVCARAKHVIEVIPPSKRSAKATRQLTEILALPRGKV